MKRFPKNMDKFIIHKKPVLSNVNVFRTQYENACVEKSFQDVSDSR